MWHLILGPELLLNSTFLPEVCGYSALSERCRVYPCFPVAELFPERHSQSNSFLYE